MKLNETIFIAGHNGMVGSAMVRLLRAKGYAHLLLRDHAALDLSDFHAVQDFFAAEKPDYVILAAAKVGGIHANMTYPADFIFENLMIQNAVIRACVTCNVKKLCFLGSSCIYPKDCPQPIKEEYLLTGPLEPTNEGYALAKIAGLKMVQYHHLQYGLSAISPMPCNIYGTNDSFDPNNSHVFAALVKKYVDAVDENAEQVTLWGTGSARREFLHVDDLARAIMLLMEHHHSPGLINVGSGKDISIKDLAALIAEKTGFRGKTVWDVSKPDGMMRKCLDISQISAMGFVPEIDLTRGVESMVEEYRKRKASGLNPKLRRTV